MRLGVLQLAVAVRAVDDQQSAADILPTQCEGFSGAQAGVAEQSDHDTVAQPDQRDALLDLQRGEDAWPRDADRDALYASARICGQFAARDRGAESVG